MRRDFPGLRRRSLGGEQFGSRQCRRRVADGKEHERPPQQRDGLRVPRIQCFQVQGERQIDFDSISRLENLGEPTLFFWDRAVPVVDLRSIRLRDRVVICRFNVRGSRLN